MTKEEAVRIYKEHILPAIMKEERPGHVDKPARSEAWGIFIDGLCKGGQITMRQYETWEQP